MLPALLAVACGRRAHTNIPAMPRPGDEQTGIASWYGDRYHGKPAANGEVFDMNKLTAAHRTLPFDTRVRVTNLSNEHTVDVRITDRGPFVDGRIIDLSKAAAREIDIIRAGITRVRLRVLDVPANAKIERGPYAVLAGSFRERGEAERLRKELRRRFSNVRIVRRGRSETPWSVLTGHEYSIDRAHQLLFRVREVVSSAIVVRE